MSIKTEIKLPPVLRNYLPARAIANGNDVTGASNDIANAERSGSAGVVVNVKAHEHIAQVHDVDTSAVTSEAPEADAVTLITQRDEVVRDNTSTLPTNAALVPTKKKPMNKQKTGNGNIDYAGGKKKIVALEEKIIAGEKILKETPRKQATLIYGQLLDCLDGKPEIIDGRITSLRLKQEAQDDVARFRPTESERIDIHPIRPFVRSVCPDVFDDDTDENEKQVTWNRKLQIADSCYHGLLEGLKKEDYTAQVMKHGYTGFAKLGHNRRKGGNAKDEGRKNEDSATTATGSVPMVDDCAPHATTTCVVGNETDTDHILPSVAETSTSAIETSKVIVPPLSLLLNVQLMKQYGNGEYRIHGRIDNGRLYFLSIEPTDGSGDHPFQELPAPGSAGAIPQNNIN